MSAAAAGRFVDCSDNNPIPNLAAYKRAGHRHLCRKVSEGVGYHWSAGDRVADGAHRIGLRVGHYHWLRPDAAASSQAAYFAGLVRPHLAAGDWLMCDYEATARVSDGGDATRARALLDFMAELADQLPGVPAFVYTGNWYLAGKPKMQAAVRRFGVVMSDYDDVAELPNPYRLNYVAWQFSDHATVPGFSAPVDYNRWLSEPAEEDHVTPQDIEAIADAVYKKVEAKLEKMSQDRAGDPRKIETLVVEGVRRALAEGVVKPRPKK